ncbi:cytochrome c oxidase subunit 4 [Herbiconiux sp. A18JL235]|uniref:Cytochrome c oxidase polypeptide 4 n=1 Tax=Herbiconiux sp. A18JL235 TaxID=3152363 RepID=A0AB39BBH9_9MICO
MRVNTNLFWILAVFMVLAATAYTVWSLIWYDGEVEWVGTVAISLTAILSGFLAFYLGKVHKSQGGELPEDRLDSNIDDGDPEMGFYSPWSWWPIVLAFGGALLVLGLAVGFWVCFIAAAVTLVAIVGWVYEYYRGNFAR